MICINYKHFFPKTQNLVKYTELTTVQSRTWVFAEALLPVHYSTVQGDREKWQIQVKRTHIGNLRYEGRLMRKTR